MRALDDARLPTIQGRYKVPHFDSKESVDHVSAEEAAPTTYLLAAFYWENFIYLVTGPRKGTDRESLSCPEMAAKMANALGRKIGFLDVPFDVYRGTGFSGAQDLGTMFEYQAILGDEFLRNRDPEQSRALNPGLLSFNEWLAKNKHLIPLD